MTQRERFAAGRIASKREELEHLRTRLENARKNLAEHPCEVNEIAETYADEDLEAFLEKNPELAEGES